MDIVRKKQNKMSLPAKAAGTLVLLASVVWAIASASTASHSVSADRVLTDTVTQGDLTIDVRGVGTLVPKEVHWVATEVNGRIDKVFIKAGAAVKRGDAIVTMSNPVLEQQLEESRWELEEVEAQLNAERVALESRVLDQETLVANSQLDFERAQLTLRAQEQLLEQGIVAISKIDHQEAKIEVKQLKQRWELEQKRFTKAKENYDAQIRAFNARLQRLERSVTRMQRLVDNLVVRATIDSVVQEMPMELGQQITAGTNIAKLARNDEFIAEVRIPEKQIYQVALTQDVTVDTKTTQVPGKVIRIDPAVVNGTVQVDIALTGNLPKEARPELTVDGIIHVAHLEDILYVKRPMFAKAHATGQLYQIKEQQVHEQQVEYGRASQTHIEIKRGLSAGANIVVSDVSDWKGKQIQQIQ